MQPLMAQDPAEIGGYRLRGRLGSGGMGVVYLAYTPGGRPVALKVVRPELGDDADFRGRFRQEIDAARRVHVLYTAQLLDCDPDASPPWLVTAYVPGPSLAQAVSQHGPMPEQSVLVLVAGVAEALAAIHAAGIVHRDLKPSNVLLAADGPRVIDFGIARALEATALTRTGMRVGSPHYMSPEQIRGGAVSAATDVFALGATACYAALGRGPFGEGNDAALLYRIVQEQPDLAGCPELVRSVIQICLAKDPAARPTPAQVIQACRSRAGAQAGAFGDSWLPPAIAADLTQHALSTPVPNPMPAAQVHPSPPAPAAQPAAFAPAPQLGQPGGSAAPPWTTPRAPGSRGAPDGRRLRTLVITITVGALVVAGLITYALLASPGQPSSHASNRTHRNQSTGRQAGQPASTSATLDSCVDGSWIGAGSDSPTTIDGHPVTFAGAGGANVTFAPDGTGTDTITPSNGTVEAVYQGNTYKVVNNGGADFRWKTRNGLISIAFSHEHGTEQQYENGTLLGTRSLVFHDQSFNYFCTTHLLNLHDTGDSGFELLNRGTG
jgi:serine/threonine protein kinase